MPGEVPRPKPPAVAPPGAKAGEDMLPKRPGLLVAAELKPKPPTAWGREQEARGQRGQQKGKTMQLQETGPSALLMPTNERRQETDTVRACSYTGTGRRMVRPRCPSKQAGGKDSHDPAAGPLWKEKLAAAGLAAPNAPAPKAPADDAKRPPAAGAEPKGESAVAPPNGLLTAAPNMLVCAGAACDCVAGKPLGALLKEKMLELAAAADRQDSGLSCTGCASERTMHQNPPPRH
jgi:hypothetical protein